MGAEMIKKRMNIPNPAYRIVFLDEDVPGTHIRPRPPVPPPAGLDVGDDALQILDEKGEMAELVPEFVVVLTVIHGQLDLVVPVIVVEPDEGRLVTDRLAASFLQPEEAGVELEGLSRDRGFEQAAC